VGRRFDVVSPVVGWLATTVALQNSKAPIRTDTGRTREVGLSTHVVESNRMIESRHYGYGRWNQVGGSRWQIRAGINTEMGVRSRKTRK
jgi:hypothetical protein